MKIDDKKFYLFTRNLTDEFPVISVATFLIDLEHITENPYLAMVDQSNNRTLNEEVTNRIGLIGEEIAFKYLLSTKVYNELKNVTQYREKGYDIIADNQLFEIKTTSRLYNQFEISENELVQAWKYRRLHNLFFIKLTKYSATGYNIKDIYTELNIDNSQVIDFFYNTKVALHATHVRISISDEYFKSLEAIDLTSFLPDNWEAKWKRLFKYGHSAE